MATFQSMELVDKTYQLILEQIRPVVPNQGTFELYRGLVRCDGKGLDVGKFLAKILTDHLGNCIHVLVQQAAVGIPQPKLLDTKDGMVISSPLVPSQ